MNRTKLLELINSKMPATGINSLDTVEHLNTVTTKYFLRKLRSYYLSLSGFLGFPLAVLWFITALYLGSTYNKAIKQQKAVC